jgi:DNA-binding NtrC family response regulator
MGAEVWGRFPQAGAELRLHNWPGNIRELRNVVCRALLTRQGPKIDASVICFEQEPKRAPEEPRASSAPS